MGDVVMTKKRRWGRLMAAAAAAFSLVLAAGCASAPASRPAVQVSESSATGAVSTPQAEPAVELASLELREGAPGVRLDLEATGPLVWTSYRDEAGNLVIELPNTVPAAQLSDLPEDL